VPDDPALSSDVMNDQFTGKERDAESGLDYFGARYYGSGLGRFTSPDPVGIMRQKLLDPQQWNAYAYVRGNPLRFVDPTGKYVELSGGEKERARQLAALKTAVGKSAGSYLYDNVDKESGKHYVGILSGGPDGKGPAFSSLGAVANKVSGIVADTQRGVTISFEAPGVTLGSDTPFPIEIGSGKGDTSPGWTSPDGASIELTSGPIAKLNASLSSNGKPLVTTLADVLGHELGNVDSIWYHGGQDSDGDAVRTENEVRKSEAEPLRLGHDKRGDVTLSGTPF